MQKTEPSPSRLRQRITLMQVLFCLNALVWALFLILFLSDQVQPGDPISSLVIPILMICNALAMLACAIGLGRRSRLSYYLSLAVIAFNLLLTITDQVGLFDYLTLLLDLLLLVLLVASYKAFARPPKSVAPAP